MRERYTLKHLATARRLVAVGAALGTFAMVSPAVAQTSTGTPTTAQPGNTMSGTPTTQGTTADPQGTGANTGTMAPGATQPGATQPDDMGTGAGTAGAGGVAQDNYGATDTGRHFPWGLIGLIGLVGLWRRPVTPTPIAGHRTT